MFLPEFVESPWEALLLLRSGWGWLGKGGGGEQEGREGKLGLVCKIKKKTFKEKLLKIYKIKKKNINGKKIPQVFSLFKVFYQKPKQNLFF